MQEKEVTAQTATNESSQLSRPRRKKKKENRSLPRSVKIGIALLLIIVSGVVGLALGYSYAGKGPVSEAFDISTYKHLYDLVFKTNL